MSHQSLKLAVIPGDGIGTEVTAEATLEKVEGRRLTFTVAVRDARSLVAAGKVTRVLVDRTAFLAKCG
jgi:predicted thioesterase